MRMCMHRAVGMSVLVNVLFLCLMAVMMFVLMTVSVAVLVIVMMLITLSQMNIELHSFNAGLRPASHVQVITIEPDFLQFMLQLVRVHPQVNQCANQHVATDPAENIQ